MMALTPEGKVKVKISAMLKAAGAYYHMTVQNGMGAPSLDYVGCYKGRFFAIEAKAPGKKPTPRQEGTIKTIRAAEGVVFVIDGAEGSFDLLKEWLS